jgi:hypothetical protein
VFLITQGAAPAAGARKGLDLRVILIKGRSTYDLLRAFIDAAGFVEAGHGAEILDVVAGPDVAAGLARRAVGRINA